MVLKGKKKCRKDADIDFDPLVAGTILDVYRRQEVHVCEVQCSLVLQAEFRYWGLDTLLLQPCCAIKATFCQPTKACKSSQIGRNVRYFTQSLLHQ